MRWSYLLMKKFLIAPIELAKEYTNKISKKKLKSTIAKFKSWKARQQLSYIRPRAQKDGKKKPRQNFSISVDLTRWC